MPSTSPSPTAAAATAELRHPKAIVYAHWLTAAALLLVFALIIGRDWLDEDPLRASVLQWHRLAGLCVAALTLVRLLLRSRLKLAATLDEATPWQRRLAGAMHGLVYLLLLALPPLGFLLSNARGHAVSVGSIHLPRLLATDLDLAETLEAVHGNVAWLLAAVIGLHLLAVAWHQWIRRDKVLGAMLPSWRSG
ncbi:cytochrome b/b6 domain-containing protein [Paucibacter sp. TC2R-5]|uniref:cytochrome b n=1 Tax=Paucibacter sp. TC2R-5 TaxID=2893555 RepID=UPI0021E3CA44|nr:cytochrome b/b6 domain-containing protein [Paucibacter sp. TC2R-5]MCV2361634.1 cytochrome b/b6 domain-containing protein [Paucibacter sp. TC2R-5]